MSVVLIDNYDSFTWNLWHYLGDLGVTADVLRNDSLSASDLVARRPEAVVLSPGPCTPDQAGLCLDFIRQAQGHIPIFGVCLGLQAIGQAYGGHVVRAPLPLHGKVSQVTHCGQGLFSGIDGPFAATRYHSLVIERTSMPADLDITAETDGLIMAASHRSHPVHGVQFHPESIASEHGHLILKNFLDLARRWNQAHSL